MANTILTPTKVTREALRILHEKLNFVGNINRADDNSFTQEGAKIGDTINIRLPNQYEVRDGATLSTQDTTETSTSLQLSNQKGVDLNFTSKDLTVSLDDFSSRILEPAMSVLAANIEADFLDNVYKDVYNTVGTVGTTPAGLKAWLDAKTKLNKALAPKDNQRYALLQSEASAASIDALKSGFNDQNELSKQFKEGIMGRAAGLTFYENESTPVHTNGTMGGTPLVNGAGQTGSTLTIDGTGTSGTFTKGTVFTIAGVYAVHPETKKQYAHLQQFTVTADATASTGAVTLSISPAITVSGATQTVSGSPADNAAITFVGGASAVIPQNIVFHKDAFTFATADLVMPNGVDFAARETFDGISMRIVRQYDINNDQLPCRLDVLYGFKTLRASTACRVVG